MDFSTQLFRCSSLGKIMSGVKPNLTDKQKETLDGLMGKKDSGKITDKQLSTLGDLIKKRDQKPTLSNGAKSYLDEIFQEVVFGRSHEIKSQYLDKGKSVEEISFSLYTDVCGLFLVKNEERFNNEWITGEPDNIQQIVRDIKSSWDFSTFPMNETELTNMLYYWQLMGYMWLTGLEKAELIYCLVDTPFNLIDDELRRLSWKLGFLSLDSMPVELKVETISNHIYTNKGLEEYCHQSMDLELDMFTEFREIIPEHRVKVFEVYYDPKAIEQLKIYLELARQYLLKCAKNAANLIRA